MQYIFSVGTADMESGAANQAEFFFSIPCDPLPETDEKLLARYAELLHKGYVAMYPLSERGEGEELTLVGVEGHLESDPDHTQDFVVGYHDGHEWQALVDFS